MTTGYDSLLVEVAEGQDPINTSSPTWTDVTTMVHNFTINRGRDNYWDAHSPGSASLTFNGDFYNDVAVVPNTPIRISANDSTATRKYLFTGFLRPQQGYVVDVAHTVTSTTLQALDFLALMGERQFTTAIVSNGKTSGELLTFIEANYTPFAPTWQTSVYDDGQTIMQDIPTGGTVGDVYQNVAFSEGGAFYILVDGTLNFDDRTAVLNTSRMANSQVTFDDTGAGDSTYGTNYSLYQPLAYTIASVTRANDDSLTITEDGVPKQTAQTFTFFESASTDLYGHSTFPAVTNMLASSNTEAAALAERLVRSTNTVVSCPQRIRLFPRKNNAHLNAAVQRELRDRATFKNALTFPSGADVWVERIQHTVDCGTKDWTCDLSFTSRDQILANYAPSLWLILNDGSNGILNTNTLAW